ncbi:MAG: hypothetical protein JKY88_02000 [Pseudomonadales bacterium]|nr:hypothetical protein [Pseudomonadales bacterium]
MSQSMQNTIVKQLPILLKREFWEHKVAIFYVPLIITLFSIGIVVLSAISAPLISFSVDVENNGPGHQVTIGKSDTSMSEIVGPQLVSFSKRSMAQKERVFEELYSGFSLLLIVPLWFVIFFYLQGSLYEDRKDRSILFWKSMPVSDGLTVASKLITALFVIPAIYLVFVVISQLAFLIIASIVATFNSVEVWSTLWAPAHLMMRWLGMMAFFLFTAFWCLPFFTWILLVSSWAKSVPFAWVMGIPILLVVIEYYLFRSSGYIREFIANHSISFREVSGGFSNFYAAGVFSMEMLLAVGIGAIFISVTIWKRGYANEI